MPSPTSQRPASRDQRAGTPPQASSQGGRGFACMDPERQRETASQGGRAAHASGNAHEFPSAEARAPGAKSHGGTHASRGAGQSSPRRSSDR